MMDAQTLSQNLLNLVDTFTEQEDNLTELDRAIGDGDHGVNMLRGFKALPDKIDTQSVASVLKSTGMTLMSNIGGASGPLYGFSFVKMSQVAEDEITADNLKQLLQAFSDAIAERGKVTLNEKTMFDVIERTRQAVDEGNKVTLETLQGFADDTKDMVATKGRAAYFKKDSKGHIDPGAQSSVYILNALIGDE